MTNQAEIFTELRPVLMKLAGRMLRSEMEAEDMVQETYLRWERATTREVRSPRAFLTTIVTRLCLNHLKLARVRLEHEDAPLLLERLSSEVSSPAEHAELADALTEAFMFALDNLSPTERAVYLLREAFAFDYGDIASVVARSEENCRQILRRARERITAKESAALPAREQNQRVVSEFLQAAETGELEPLLKLLSFEAALARDVWARHVVLVVSAPDENVCHGECPLLLLKSAGRRQVSQRLEAGQEKIRAAFDRREGRHTRYLLADRPFRHGEIEGAILVADEGVPFVA